MKHAFFLGADHGNPISSDPNLLQLFRAKIITSIIFSANVTLTDAQVLNSRNFRHLISKDDEFKKLLGTKAIRIAVRSNNIIDVPAGSTPLHTVQRVFWENTLKNNPMVHIPRDSFLNEQDIAEIYERNVPIDKWDVWSARLRFTSLMQSEFKSERAEEVLGRALQQSVSELIEDEIEEDNGLGRAWLDSILYDKIRARHFEMKPSQSNYIKSISAGNFLSNIPDMLWTAPVFEKNEAGYFDLARRREAAKYEIEGVTEFTTHLSANLFVSAINNLSVKQILKIRKHAFAKDYHRLCDSYFRGKAGSAQLRAAAALLCTMVERVLIEDIPGVRARIDAPRAVAIKGRIDKADSTLNLIMESVGSSLPFFSIFQKIFFKTFEHCLDPDEKIEADWRETEARLTRENFKQYLRSIPNAQYVEYRERSRESSRAMDGEC